jgi:hypothetical protein
MPQGKALARIFENGKRRINTLYFRDMQPGYPHTLCIAIN